MRLLESRGMCMCTHTPRTHGQTFARKAATISSGIRLHILPSGFHSGLAPLQQAAMTNYTMSEDSGSVSQSGSCSGRGRAWMEG